MTHSETQSNRSPTPGVTPNLLSRYETGHKNDKATALSRGQMQASQNLLFKSKRKGQKIPLCHNWMAKLLQLLVQNMGMTLKAAKRLKGKLPVKARQNLAQSMQARFSNLGQMFQAQNKELRDTIDEEMSPSHADSGDSDVSYSEAAPAKRRKTDDTTDSILPQCYNAENQDGPEIHSSLAEIVSNMMEEKSDDDKLNELRKKYAKPENCELFTETKVESAIWNNLSEKARTSDIKLQKSQKFLMKGTTAVVNDLLNNSEWPPK